MQDGRERQRGKGSAAKQVDRQLDRLMAFIMPRERVRARGRMDLLLP